MKQAASAQPVTETLAENVAARIAETGCSKRTAVRLALLDAIHDGRFAIGDMLPPERALAAELGISLGTVQGALNDLRESGRITRRRGDGTRVAAGADKLRTTWHFRMLDRETGQPLFWDSTDVEVAEVGAAEPYASFLKGARDFVHIRRRVLMGGGHRVGADLWMGADLGRPLLRMNPTDLSLINLRSIFADKLGLKPARVETEISTLRPDETRANGLALQGQKLHFQIEARVYASDDTPLYFQTILAAVDGVKLSF